jgi:lipocalin
MSTKHLYSSDMAADIGVATINKNKNLTKFNSIFLSVLNSYWIIKFNRETQYEIIK